jgi:glycosyltransferase involved in cell wall biosynthesis
METGRNRKENIKVLHIIESGNIGGAENIVYQICKYQHGNERDIEPTIYFKKPEGIFFEKSINSKINTISPGRKKGIYHFFNTLRMFRNYDILHFHGLYPELFLAAIFSHRKLIYYVHGASALTKSVKTVLKNIASSNSRDRFPTLKGMGRAIKRQWFKIFLRYFVEIIHAPSQSYVDFYIRTYQIPANKIVKLPLGIDFTLLQVTKKKDQIRDDLGIKTDKTIGCVSTFRKLKRIDRLINSYSQMIKGNEKRPNSTLLIVGDGSERKNIESLIQKNNLDNHVILTGFRNDIPDLLNIIDLFILPSEFENFPLSVIEAMYFKIPIIVFRNSGGAEELVSHSQGGFVVQDEPELTEKIHYLLTHVDESKRIGEKAGKYVTDHLSMAQFSNKIEEVYQELITYG